MTLDVMSAYDGLVMADVGERSRHVPASRAAQRFRAPA